VETAILAEGILERFKSRFLLTTSCSLVLGIFLREARVQTQVIDLDPEKETISIARFTLQYDKVKSIILPMR
jgi:hypothetical protein